MYTLVILVTFITGTYVEIPVQEAPSLSQCLSRGENVLADVTKGIPVTQERDVRFICRKN